MGKIVTLENDEIRLCTNLTESAFGKTHARNGALTQEGYLFDGKNIKIWTFDEVRSFDVEGRDERIVFYCGKNPLSNNAKSLASYFENDGEHSEDCFKAAISVINAFTFVANTQNTLPQIGAGGIFVDLSSPSPTILFMPEELFKYSCNGLSKEDYLLNHTGWINQTIHDLPSLCFTRATIAYKLLTGHFPYPATDTTERNSDILDRKFLPLELCINGVNKTLAIQINRALKLNSNVVNIPGKKQKGKASEDLTPTPDFPVELMKEAWELSKRTKKENNSDFTEKVEKFTRIQDSNIKIKRNVRRNLSLILGGLVSVLVLVSVVVNTIKSNLDEYTSTGLTSTQTIQAFFMGVNAKDTVLLSNISKGKSPTAFTDTVSRVFVMHKQRQAYSNDNGFATPENWLMFIANPNNYSRSGIYGITNLQIDSKPYEPQIKMLKKNENPIPLTREGNVTLQKGSESVHKVEYYLVRTEGEIVDFVVEQITEIFTLTFKGERWIITDLQTQSTELKLDCEQFKKDYYEALQNNSDVLSVVNILRNNYKWLPTNQAMQTEKQRIIDEIEKPLF